MYFGMNSLITTLSSALVSLVFAVLLPAFGYDTALDVQPASVGTGFRVFMAFPTVVASLLAVAALFGYPLHGARLESLKADIAVRRKTGG